MPLRSSLRATFASLIVALALAAHAPAQLSTFGVQYWDQNSTDINDSWELGDEFGRALAVGDFNCDGYDDLAIGIPYEDVTFDCDGKGGATSNECTDAGAVHVIYGSALGLHPSLGRADQFWTQASSGVPDDPQVGARFGWSLAVVEIPKASGNDGCWVDLAVGAPYRDVTSGVVTHENAGAVYYFRGTDAGLVADGSIVQGRDWVPESPESDDRFGYAIAQGPYLHYPYAPSDCPPSMNGTGTLAIGAPGEDLGVGGDDEGVVVLLMMPCGAVFGDPDLPGAIDCDPIFADAPPCQILTPYDENESGWFGAALAGTGFRWSLENESRYLAIGGPLDDEFGTNAGRLELQADADTNGELWPSSYPLWQGDSGAEGSMEADDQLGASVVLGDFDGDGDPDLATGAPYENVNSNTVLDGGGVSVFYAAFDQAWGMPRPSGGGPPSGQLFDQDETGFETAQAEDHFGEALAVGDFNADGRDDLAIGVPDEGVGGHTDAGFVHVLYGSASGLTVAGDQGFSVDDPAIPGDAQTDDYFGEAVAAGDFDGDGRDDLAISAPGETGVNTTGGGVFVLFGGLPGGFLDAIEVTNHPLSTVGEATPSYQINVERTGNLTLPLNVNVIRRLTGTATVGADYTDFSGTQLSWAAAEGGVKSFSITILQDTLDEPSETIVIGFDASSHCREPNDFSLPIIDDDGPGEIKFLTLSTTRSEAIGNASVNVSRTNGNSPGATAQYTTSNLTAIAGVDYTTTSGTVTFGSNDSLESISIPVANDGVPEGCEYVKLTLSNPGGGAELGTPSVAQLVIYDTGLNLVHCDGFELASTGAWSATSP